MDNLKDLIKSYNLGTGKHNYVLDAIANGSLDKIEELIFAAESATGGEESQIASEIGRLIIGDCFLFADDAQYEPYEDPFGNPAYDLVAADRRKGMG